MTNRPGADGAATPAHADPALSWARPGVRLDLLVAVVTLGVYPMTSASATSILYVFVSAMPVVALSLGVWINRPRRAMPWLLMAAGQAGFLIGDIIWHAGVLGGEQPGFPSASDVPHLLGYPLMAAGILIFIRERHARIRLAPIVDGIVFNFHDVTDRVEAEAEHRFRTLHRTSSARRSPTLTLLRSAGESAD